MPHEAVEKSWLEKKSEAIETLKKSGFQLGGIHLFGMGSDGKGMSANAEPLAPNTYAENAGIIRFASPTGGNYAIPSTEKVHALLKTGDFKLVDGLVPNLNDRDVWSGGKQGNENVTYNEWRNKSLDAIPEMRAEAEALRASQDRARSVFEAGNQAEAEEPAKQAKAEQLAEDIKSGKIG